MRYVPRIIQEERMNKIVHRFIFHRINDMQRKLIFICYINSFVYFHMTDFEWAISKSKIYSYKLCPDYRGCQQHLARTEES